MTHTAEQLHSFVAACEQFRGAKAPDGYRGSLALEDSTNFSTRRRRSNCSPSVRP